MEGAGDHQQEDNKNKKEESLPPGFRFHPSDEELITYYLVNKIADNKFTGRAVADVDLNKCEPWDLPGKAKMGEKEWYFFSQRDRKYPTGVRTNRATNSGYWKTTGKDKEIYNSVTTELVGMKKTLVFYKGRAPRGEKSNWVMHEYRVHSKSAYRNPKDEWVICRIFKKSAGIKKYPTTQSSRPIINLDLGNHILSAPMMSLDPTQFPLARNYMVNNNVDLAELSRALRTGGSTSSSLPMIHPQLSYPLEGGGGGGTTGGGGGGGFGLSGLNLNLGGAGVTSQGSQLRSINTPAQGPHDVVSSMLNGLENGYGSLDMNMQGSCGEFDNYWPTY